jgi:hypothetical protein
MDTETHTMKYHGWTITVKWVIGLGYQAKIDDGLDEWAVCDRAGSIASGFEFAKHDIDRMRALAGGDELETL